MVISRDLDLGKIFNVQFGPDRDVATRVAVAGSTGSVKVWDLSTSSVARKAFGISTRAKEANEEGKIVGVVDDKADDDSDGGGEQQWEEMDDD